MGAGSFHEDHIPLLLPQIRGTSATLLSKVSSPALLERRGGEGCRPRTPAVSSLFLPLSYASAFVLL